MNNQDFVIKYKLPSDTSWRELKLNMAYFPPDGEVDDIVYEMREYLYIEINKIDGYVSHNTHQINNLIEEGIMFSNGSIYDEARIIHGNVIDDDLEEDFEFFEYRLCD